MAADIIMPKGTSENSPGGTEKRCIYYFRSSNHFFYFFRVVEENGPEILKQPGFSKPVIRYFMYNRTIQRFLNFEFIGSLTGIEFVGS
jgi:hypothetical protein